MVDTVRRIRFGIGKRRVVEGQNENIQSKKIILMLMRNVTGLCNRYSMAVSNVWHIHVPRARACICHTSRAAMLYVT